METGKISKMFFSKSASLKIIQKIIHITKPFSGEKERKLRWHPDCSLPLIDWLIAMAPFGKKKWIFLLKLHSKFATKSCGMQFSILSRIQWTEILFGVRELRCELLSALRLYFFEAINNDIFTKKRIVKFLNISHLKDSQLAFYQRHSIQSENLLISCPAGK